MNNRMTWEFREIYGIPGEKYDESIWQALFKAWSTAWNRSVVGLEEHQPTCLTNEERRALLAGANCLASGTDESKRQAEILRGFVREDRPIGYGQWKAGYIARQIASFAFEAKASTKYDIKKQLLRFASGLSGDDEDLMEVRYNAERAMAPR